MKNRFCPRQRSRDSAYAAGIAESSAPTVASVE
jgi:hypothetical protein